MTIICIAEDRPSETVPVKLLLLSLATHCPDLKVILTFPSATAEFKRWVSQLTQVELRTEAIAGTSGGNVKPQALLPLLAEGHEEVWWLDSDIIVTQDFRRALGAMPPETFGVSEESLVGGQPDKGYRAKAWGFPVGRTLPFALNSSVLRVTPAHIPLLQRWKTLLESDLYRSAQRPIWSETPVHLARDRDVLTALLCSREFSDLPIRLLHRGQDIIQYCGPSGYTLRERLSNLRCGLPPFIHAQGFKPWRFNLTSAQRITWSGYYHDLCLEVSPYSTLAARYERQLGEHAVWLNYPSPLGRLLKLLGLGSPALTGLPLALMDDLRRRSQGMIFQTPSGCYPLSQTPHLQP